MHRVAALRCAGGQVAVEYGDGRVDVYDLSPAFFAALAAALDDPGWLALRAALSRPGRWAPVPLTEAVECGG